MGILLAILIGAIIGWLATMIVNEGDNRGLLASIVIGIVGAIIGNVLSMLITGMGQNYMQFTWAGVLWSLGGSLLLVILLGLFRSRPSRNL